jgi:lipopolysaccharide transport protein LptA
MLQNYKILLIIYGFLYLPFVIPAENVSFQNISIQSDQVTIDKKTKQLVFKNNVEIKINGYVIKGSNALFSSKDEKLEIYGNPASIQSEEIDGEAEVFEIYPNKSMNLIGNAKLLNKGNSITSNFITYQIIANEY